MFYCKYCGKEFETVQQLGGHTTCCKFNKNRTHNHSIPKHIYTFNCLKCNKEFKLELTENQYINGKHKKYCSRTCANSRVHTNESKQKISKSLLDNKKSNNDKLKNIQHCCRVCNRLYIFNKELFPGCTKNVCSDACKLYMKNNRKEFLSDNALQKLHLAGLKSVEKQSLHRRSKNEIYFYELCKKYFKNVLHNEHIFNGWDADVIIEDIKFAILWNGKWHYEKIKKEHSVKQVQNRDNIKIKEITKCGYIPYIIKDMGKYNKTFVNEQFNIFIEFLKNNNYIAG